MKIVIASHIFSCFFLTGLIWTIQLIHYPSFKFAREQFNQFHKFHSSRITLIVLPLMLTELLSASVIAFRDPSGFWLFNFGAVVALWMATALLSVPQHNQLSKSFDLTASAKLTYTNWVRTIIWTARSICLLIFLVASLK